MSWFKPVAIDVEEAVRPVAGANEEDEEENGAVDAWPVQEIA